MPIDFTLARQVPDDIDVLAVGVFSDLSATAGAELDLGYLARRGFDGSSGQTAALPSDDGSVVVAVGLGHRDAVGVDAIRDAAACMVKAASGASRVATTLLDAIAPGTDRAAAAQALAEGAALAAYRFDRFRGSGTARREGAAALRIESVVVSGAGGAKVASALQRGARLAGAVALARDLVNTPAGDLTPTGLADIAADAGEASGLSVMVWDEVDARRERLGGLLGVAAGSDQPPRLVQLAYEPTGRSRGHVALVGKGITFDSGGLSLKTAEGMETMKTDMGGAAAVLAAMTSLSEVGAPVRVTGYLPITENMPGGRAIKPGDVLKIRNGKTVEVLNTDAEGRLVLADGLSLAAEGGPDAIVDLATLTGACQVALGLEYAGLMGNDDGWLAQVEGAAARAGEKVWRLPLPAEYRRHIDSDIADMKNTGTKHGGALTAGLFLQEFVGDVPWAHIDIAGPARAVSDDVWIAKGGTGFGVRTLVELLAEFKPLARAR